MVGGDTVYHALGLMELLGHVHADADVGALHLVVDGLSDIVQQARTLGQLDIGAQFGGHHARQVGYLLSLIHICPRPEGRTAYTPWAAGTRR